MNEPLVSILVPAYNCEIFIEELIISVLNQTYSNYIIIISNDASNDNTLKICQQYSNNYKNIDIYSQPNNIGWVKNVNYLIEKSKGDYFIILPADDIIDEKYIKKLMSYMLINNNIVNCFPIIRCIGNKTHKIKQPNIYGILNNRLDTYLQNIQCSSVSFRGLVNKKIIQYDKNLLYLPENIYKNIKVDTIQILQQLLVGELYCVSVPYFKRYHQNNEHIINWKLTKDEYDIWKKTYIDAIINILIPYANRNQIDKYAINIDKQLQFINYDK